MFYDNLIAFLPEIAAWLTGGLLGTSLMYIYMDLQADGVNRKQCESLIKARLREKDAVNRGHHALKAQKMHYNDKLNRANKRYCELKQRNYELRKTASQLN